MDFASVINAAQTPPATRNDTAPAPSLNETAAPADTSSSSTSQAEEFDTFLELLTAQIRNQDPLAPLDSTQFVEQLATFSNLELQAKNNQILEGIANLLASQLADNAPDAETTDAETPAS